MATQPCPPSQPSSPTPRTIRGPRAGRPAPYTHPAWFPWRIPGLLLAFCIVPVGAGISRLVELAGSGPVTPQNARFFAAPLPVIIHVVSVGLYGILGAFQFSTELRHRYPRWHRRAGRLVVPAGLLAASSGLWMQATYALPSTDGLALAVQRVFVGTAMLAFLVLGLLNLHQRSFARHGAHMLRAYALGMGAGTQVLTHISYLLLVGEPDMNARAWLMGSAWLANLLVAEWVIHRRRQ